MGAKHAKQAMQQQKQTPHPKAVPYDKMAKTTKNMYYRAEFKSMGDLLKDGRLNLVEFTRLMRLLGLPDASRSAEVVFKKQKKVDHDRLTVDEYVSIMSDPTVDAKTSMWRKLFAQFDTDGSGWASRQDVFEGLENIGITITPDLRAKINAMDGDKDGRINYGDFLKMQLLNK